MQGIYTFTSIPETNYVPREYSVAAILLLLFMVLILLFSVPNLLYFYISTFRSMCALPIVILLLLLYYNFLTSCKPVSFSRRILHDGVSIITIIIIIIRSVAMK